MSEDSTATQDTPVVEDEYNNFVDGNDTWDNIEVPEDLEVASSDVDSSSTKDEWDDIEPVDVEEGEASGGSKEVEGESTDTEENSSDEGKKDEKEGKPSTNDSNSPEEAKKEVTINSDTIKNSTFKVKVDGKEVELSGQELLNRASGDIAVEKRLLDLDKEKKEFYSEKSAVEQYISDFGTKVKNGNILGGLEYFGQFAGLPSYVLKEQLIAALQPEIESRSYMTPEELRNSQLRAENEYLAQKTESDAKRIAEEQALEADLQSQREFDSHINSLKETHSITEQEWDLAFTQLDSEIPPGEEITPSMVVQKANEVRSNDQTSSRVQKLVKDYEGELNDDYVTLLKKVAMENPDYSDEDLNVVIKESLRLHKENKLKDRLSDKVSKNTNKSLSVEEEDEHDLSEFLDEDGW